jgi:uncharacterized C2H2 Zn-finger protein
LEKRLPVTDGELRSSLLGLIIIVIVIAASALLLLTTFWFVWPMILVLALVIIAYITASKKLWRCPSCGKTYRISVLQDFLAFHGLEKGVDGRYYEWKDLKCPSCGERSRAYPVSDHDGPSK